MNRKNKNARLMALMDRAFEALSAYKGIQDSAEETVREWLDGDVPPCSENTIFVIEWVTSHEASREESSRPRIPLTFYQCEASRNLADIEYVEKPRTKALITLVATKLSNMGFRAKSDLSKAMGIVPSALGNYLAGRTFPSAENALFLLDWLYDVKPYPFAHRAQIEPVQIEQHFASAVARLEKAAQTLSENITKIFPPGASAS